MVSQHVHQLVRPLLHPRQRHEDAASLLDGRGRDEEIQEHFDAVLPCPAQHQQRVLPIRRMIGYLGDRLEQRLVVHTLQRD